MKVTKKGKFVMGMAAGQARLLSITSRMSDNELRAQLINNDKMRLATKSSQVSEAYVQALNDAQLMFTNYDANNNASYQQLTFNALTAYNPYNNQYALSNASGKILVSEKDATNFQYSSNLTEFLAKYGLEQTTSYWDSIATKDDDGNAIIKYPGLDSDSNVIDIIAETAEDLKNMYEGKGKYTDSYMNIISSEYYYDYVDKYQIFQTAQTELYKDTANKMVEKFKAQFTLKEEITADNAKTMCQTLIDKLGASGFTELLAKGDKKIDTYVEYLKEELTNAKEGISKTEITTTTEEQLDNYLVIGNFALKYNTTTTPKTLNPELYLINTTYNENEKKDIIKIDKQIASSPDADGIYTLYYKEQPGATEDDDPIEEYLSTPPVDWQTNGYTQIKLGPIPKDAKEDQQIEFQESITDEEIASVAKSVLENLEKSICSLWDPSNAAFINQEKSSDGTKYTDELVEAYDQAAKELIASLGIDNKVYTINNYADLDNVLGLDADVIFKSDNTDKQNFINIQHVLLLDNVMNTYGEPKYTWIDSKNPNENAETKAAWYENLYLRMQKGYTTLKDGLASSTEWIKFALESGMVVMEQVDSNRNWNSTIYSNCSDITEQTNSAAVTKAEAEYNAAMKKIENKDKMYDLELKNIDTEHNSLQTEYESIKSAIDKNVERTFKIYS